MTQENTDMAMEAERLVSAARDSMTDDMVSRFAEMGGSAADLLDRVNRSGVTDALPAVAELVRNGDLDRVVKLARLVSAAEDSVTDDMISRAADMAGGGMDLLDRVNRSGIADALPVLARLVESGDLDRVAKLSRLVVAAEDSVTDDMVSRLAEMAGSGMDLLDQVNRANVVKALPTVTRLVESGDLDRIAQLSRLVVAAEDSVTDDMIARLSDMAGTGMDLLDQVNRSHISRALPAISRMVENGDLDRLVDMVRLYSAAEDAMTDEMVGRLVDVMGEGISLLDSANRSGVRQLVSMLQTLDEKGSLETLATTLPKLADQLGMLEDMIGCMENATREAKEHPATGGIGGLVSMMLNKENQQFLNFVFSFGRNLRARCVARISDK